MCSMNAALASLYVHPSTEHVSFWTVSFISFTSSLFQPLSYHKHSSGRSSGFAVGHPFTNRLVIK